MFHRGENPLKSSVESSDVEMYLHIGDGIMVKKAEVIAILDARKILAARYSQVFFDAFRAGDRTANPVKSFILVTSTDRHHAQRRRRNRETSHHKKVTVMVSAIASTTLEKRFHENQAIT